MEVSSISRAEESLKTDVNEFIVVLECQTR